MFPTRHLFTQAYRAKRPWPPDFTRLTPTQQFRLEKTYRRRTKLMYARPELQRNVTIAQWTIGLFVIWYGVFWVDWPTKDHLFVPVRKRWRDTRDSFWTVPGKSDTREAAIARAPPDNAWKKP